MDQVKLVLAVLKKQHFWVLSAIVVIVGLGIWYSAAGTLASQYQERETKLNTQRKAVQDITKSADPPNQLVIDAIGDAHRKLKDEVYQAWTLLYQVQKETNPWPDVLGEQFIDAAEALKPGENYLKPGEEFKDWKHPEWYWQFIQEYLPRLGVLVDVREPKSVRDERLKPKAARRPIVKKIDKKKLAENAAAEKKAAEEMAEDEIVGKVVWDENNELMIRQQFEWDTRPTTLQVLIAQENLWVYEALLRIIRDTNEGSASYYKCPVKQIFSLEIGREAATALASSRSAGGMGGMGGMYGGSSGPMGMGSMYGPGGPMGMGAGAGMPGGADASASAASGTPGAAAALSPQEMIAAALLDSRYVDQKGQPLTYGTDPPFPQFKMMPVRMLLLVDQRRIPRLLAQCANSSMPVEVKRVILRPDQVQGLNLAGPSGSGGSGMPGMTGGMPGMAGGMPGMAGGMPGMPSRAMGGMASASASPDSMYGGMPGAKGGAARIKRGSSGPSSMPGMPGMTTGMPGASTGGDEESPWDMKVEIQGIIYIFNPPDRSKFDIAETPAAAPGASAPTAPGGAATPAAAGEAAAVPGKAASPGPAPAASGAAGASGTGAEKSAPSGEAATPAAPAPGPAPAPAAGSTPAPTPGPTPAPAGTPKASGDTTATPAPK